MVGRIGRFVLVAVATFLGLELIEFGTGTSIVRGAGAKIGEFSNTRITLSILGLFALSALYALIGFNMSDS